MFYKESRLRSVLIAVLFALGLAFVYLGWTIKGQMIGLLTMLLGVASLISSIFVYNKPYK
ncbi:MAG: hypothetical protein IIX54_03975 [Clostridia bacterium]|nr:hypothetical protein [Clostridia bacterium]